MSFEKTIDKDAVNELPLEVFDGPIHLIDSIDKLNTVLPKITELHRLGFDTETRPSFKKGRLNKVSLLQLSSPKEAFLFRLNHIGLPKEIRKILYNPDVIKVGAAIHDDIKSLQKIKPFKQQGFIDLQSIVGDYGIEVLSLKKLSAIVLDFRISKSQQLSNWEADELTEAQQRYAATDAWVSLQIFNKLQSVKSNTDNK